MTAAQKLSIRVPSGRRVTLWAYVAAWKRVKAMHCDEMVRGWSDFPVSAASVRADLLFGLHDRINLRGGIRVRDSRAGEAVYAMARTPRVRIEPNAGRRMPPAARRALAGRIHAFED